MISKKDTNWPITVAQAAPAIPQSNTNINKGSSIVLIMAPASMINMDCWGEPSDLTRLAPPEVKIIKGSPKAVMDI